MIEKFIRKQNETLLIASEIRQQALLRIEIAKHKLNLIRANILEETEAMIRKNEDRYRELCRKGKHITNPKDLRSLELRMIIHRLEHESQKAGRSRYEFDFNKFLYLLRITSNID